MARKTVNINQSGINNLPNDKPAVYKIITTTGSSVRLDAVVRRVLTPCFRTH